MKQHDKLYFDKISWEKGEWKVEPKLYESKMKTKLESKIREIIRSEAWEDDQVIQLLALFEAELKARDTKIGQKFWDWFYDEKKYRYEAVEEAIERITGVKDPAPYELKGEGK